MGERVSTASSLHPTRPEARRATLALLVATLFWGCGFTWAKAAGEAVPRVAGLAGGSGFGPIFVLGWRFALASALLFVAVRRARAGWTWRGAGRIASVGLLVSLSLVLQHLGLDRTSEAVSAFLTSLTILFVPLTLTLVLRRPPAPVMWLGVVLATAGVWLMTWAAPGGFGAGEALGLMCALGFALYILAVNAVAKTEDAWQMTAGQFLVVAITCFAACAWTDGRPFLHPASAVRLLVSTRDVWQNVVLLTLFPTVGAFTLLNVYQPKLDPTRAALIYLVEPVVAATYAWLMAGRRLDAHTVAGAGLILAANILVEVLSVKSREPAPVPDSAPTIAPASSPR